MIGRSTCSGRHFRELCTWCKQGVAAAGNGARERKLHTLRWAPPRGANQGGTAGALQRLSSLANLRLAGDESFIVFGRPDSLVRRRNSGEVVRGPLMAH